MSARTAAMAGLLLPCMLTGCIMVPGPRGGISMVPILPPVVVLESEPYYVHEGYYYYYRDNGWYYSRARQGPWTTLPRDHYPREVRYKRNAGAQHDKGRNYNSGRGER